MNNTVPFWLTLLVGAIGVWMVWETAKGFKTGKATLPLRQCAFDRNAQPVGYWLSMAWCAFVVVLTAMVVLAAMGLDVRFWL
jgi:hypothetical protein